MKLEKGKISNVQLTILIISFMQSMILTIDFTYAITMQSTWIAVLVGYALFFFIVLVYLAIARRFPGMNLIQINDAVFGPWVGKLFSLAYVWFFFQLIIHYMYFFSNFWVIYIMPETPRLVFIAMFTFVCALAARKGIEVIARCSFLFLCIAAVATLVITVLLIGEMKPAYLFPLVDVPFKNMVQSVHVILAIPFCDMVVFLMVLPSVSDQQNLTKPLLAGISLGVVELLIVVLRDTAVLGPQMLTLLLASFEVSRFIDIANVLTRLDILVAITLLITLFMKVTVHYYVTVLSIAQTLKLRSYLPLVVPLGVLVAAIANNLYSSNMEQAAAAAQAWPFNAVLYEVALPLITWIVIALRKLRKKEEVQTQ